MNMQTLPKDAINVINQQQLHETIANPNLSLNFLPNGQQQLLQNPGLHLPISQNELILSNQPPVSCSTSFAAGGPWQAHAGLQIMQTKPIEQIQRSSNLVFQKNGVMTLPDT